MHTEECDVFYIYHKIVFSSEDTKNTVDIDVVMESWQPRKSEIIDIQHYPWI